MRQVQHELRGVKVELAVSERLRLAMSTQLNQQGMSRFTPLSIQLKHNVRLIKYHPIACSPIVDRQTSAS